MDPDAMAMQYDPAPLMQMMASLFGPSMMPQGNMMNPAPSGMPAGGGLPTSPAVPTPYSDVLEPRGGTNGVDSTDSSGGTGALPNDPNAAAKKSAAFDPKTMAMLQAMMPKGPQLFLAPAGHIGAGAAANLAIPRAMPPSLGQLIGGR